MTVILERGMTAAAFEDYLAASEDTSRLVGKLGADVNGDLLINVIADAGSANPAALQPLGTFRKCGFPEEKAETSPRRGTQTSPRRGTHTPPPPTSASVRAATHTPLPFLPGPHHTLPSSCPKSR